MFHGQWNPPTDEVLFRNYFPEKKDGFFVECGAADGLIHSCCLFFEEQGWRGINIEPSDVAYERLIKNRPSSLNLKIGLGNFDHTTKFTKAVKDNYGGGCIEWHPRFKREVMAEGYIFEDVDIEVMTYRKLVGGNVNKVDLFVLDVDGYELQVIDGMIGSTNLPDVFCVEYPLVKIENLKELLVPIGYKLDFISFNNAFFSLKSLDFKEKKEWFGKTDKMEY